MCTVAAGAMVLGSYMQMSAQRKAANAQMVAQDRQMKAEQEQNALNAKLKARQAEQTAEAYARKQKEMNDRFKLIQGANAANAGASGVSSTTGSAWDVAEAANEQYVRNSRDILENQRNDIFGMEMEEFNLRKNANHIKRARQFNKQQYKSRMRSENIQSMLSLASSIGGMRHKKVNNRGGINGFDGKPIDTSANLRRAIYESRQDNFTNLYNGGGVKWGSTTELYGRRYGWKR